MKLVFKTAVVAAVLLTLFNSHRADAQGCVAIRHFSSCNGNTLSSAILAKGDWQLGSNYRYFKSFRHFRGTHEEPDRIANNTEVINHSHAWDFSLTYGMSNRAFAYLSLPLVLNERSSLYEHGRTSRNTTFSRGIADVRLGAGYWLISPDKNTKGNLAVGLGIKLPTGNYQATDIFYNVGPQGEPQVRPVDQSIQPGDGGFGFSAEIQMYRQLANRVFAYGSGFYLLNPREANGVRTFRETLSPVLQNEAIMSVPDQYALRAGVNYGLGNSGLGASLGARHEGVPVRDLLGGSAGFRRPGTVTSVEPGINYQKKDISFSLSVPVAIHRNRPQSVTDQEAERLTGTSRHGDAAFADYLINLGIQYRIKGKAKAGETNSSPMFHTN
ncbi:hypothetical protein [Cesiribacter sp. SM1]|uniref:hypothetical protein n=1 Tax=Cesiribacter sp. SM1 TaxID=2861196 RepID=UPI001CD19EBE|nr:hypothetical protein [Cesiribacter sp. SM1]